jgi:hypothetical protein
VDSVYAEREQERVPSHWWSVNPLAGGPRSAAKRATEMEGSGSATKMGFLRRRWGKIWAWLVKKGKKGCRGKNTWEEGEEGDFVKSQQNDAVSPSFFSFFSFLI